MIHLDFETRSTINLITDGTYKYAMHPTTDMNCVSWAVGDEGEKELWFPRWEPVPQELLDAVESGLLIAAWNAQFERLIWNNVLVRYGVPALPIQRFYCVAANARARGFPGKLEKAAQFAQIPHQKDMDGHYLMLKLCKPRSIEEDGTIIWWDAYADQLRQGEYCKQDVQVERTLYLSIIPFNQQELEDYWLSEEINDRGVLVDRELAEAAVTGVESEKITADDVIARLTDGDDKTGHGATSCTQVARILSWVEQEWKPLTTLDKDGNVKPSLAKSTILDALQEHDIPPHVADVLELRLENSKAAVSKFQAMLNKSDDDGCVRGLFVFHGAGPGRFTSYGLQVQNLVRESRLDAIPVLKKHGIPGLAMMGEPVKLLSQMVRPAFIAAPGKTFLVGDFSQMQVRITAWLAGETKLLDMFGFSDGNNGARKVKDAYVAGPAGKDVYCAFGTVAFARPITKADIMERFVSKGCILGLGFGGAEGALARTLKKENVVLPPTELKTYVKTYRSEYSKIPAYWYTLRDACLLAMYSREVVPVGPIAYLFDGVHLWCRLPNGRLLCYPFARVVTDDWGDSVEYRRGNRSPKSGVMEWPVERLWYGQQIENLAQAIEFDLMMLTLRRMREWFVRMHVHDEIVPEVAKEMGDELIQVFLTLMCQGAEWCEDLPIAAEGHVTERYVK